MSKTSLDAGIPILTEVIEDSGNFVASSKPQDAARPVPRPEVVDVPLIDGWLTEEWNRLERKIGGRILSEVMASVEAEIENRVRNALADVLQLSVETMAKEVTQNLRTSLEDVIAQAVHREISRMQFSKK
ncbi:MAG TPA: hypothetical protein VF798_11230 [Burkholderiaceae bacterium]